MRKAEEFHEICRLEDLLDLGGAEDACARAALSAARSLAGAADVASLARARATADGDLPPWATTIGIRWPAESWLSGIATAGSSQVEVVPGASGHRPEGRFIVFQREWVERLARGRMTRASAQKIIAAFAEMASNAREHGDSAVVPYSTFEIADGCWEFSVTDLGMGVADTLRTNPMYSGLGEVEAVKAALSDGVSRHTEPGHGTGFGTLMRALAEHECTVRLRTGGIVVRWSGTGIGTAQLRYGLVAPRPGVHIRVAGQL